MCSNWPKAQFPLLIQNAYISTSPCTRKYNCIAWAAGDISKWWEPDRDNQWYWPQGLRREYTVDALFRAYEKTCGYQVCSDGTLEQGQEKIAIFAKPVLGSYLLPTHAARQLDNGTWTSKLGDSEDITHFDLNSVSGSGYGSVVAFMGRPRKPSLPT